MDNLVIIHSESGLQYDWKSIAQNPGGHYEPQMDLVAYKALYVNKIAQTRACGNEPMLVSLPIIDEDRYFAYITRGMRTEERKNVLYWLGGSTKPFVICMSCITLLCSVWQRCNAYILLILRALCLPARRAEPCLCRMVSRSPRQVKH